MAKKKKKKEEKLLDFELLFTDTTMVQVDGKYDRVKELIEGDKESAPVVLHRGRWQVVRPPRAGENVGPHEWVIKTSLTISSPFGDGYFVLDMYHDRRIYIVEYYPSQAGMFQSPDLSCLARWSQEAGWKYPQPIPSLVKANIPYWRAAWETLLIDSDFLDERFGERKTLAARNFQKSVEEEIEDEQDVIE